MPTALETYAIPSPRAKAWLKPAKAGGYTNFAATRLELSPTCFYILPYHHLELAKFESGDAGDTLTISFLKHKVRIAGRNLRKLAVGVQGRAIEWLKPVPERYAAVAGIEACAIESIEIE